MQELKYDSETVQRVQKLRFYYENPRLYQEAASTFSVKCFEHILKEPENYQLILERSLIQKEDSEELGKLCQNFPAEWLEREIFLMVFCGSERIAFTVRGIFLGKNFLDYEEVQLASWYRLTIYLNQICLRFYTKEMVAQFWYLLEQLLGAEKCVKADNYIQLLSMLQKLEYKGVGEDDHFSSQVEYEKFVSALAQREFGQADSETSALRESLKHKNARLKERWKKHFLYRIGRFIKKKDCADAESIGQWNYPGDKLEQLRLETERSKRERRGVIRPADYQMFYKEGP